MSNLADLTEQGCDSHPGCDALLRVLLPKSKDLGGFSVRRSLPTVGTRMIGPWVFFDHMGPAEFSPGEGISVRPHPHIGIATVTYLFEGEILHRDSLGSYQAIRPGDINLMVAGSGIVHSERERPEITATAHRLHGLQLWLALPEDQQEVAPAFHHYPSAEIPAVDVDGVPVRVMMGGAYGKRSPVKTFSDTLYMEADLRAGQQLVLPDVAEMGVYVAAGALQIGERELPTFSMGVLSGGQGVVVTATSDSRLAVIGGEPLGKRVMEWNFVSTEQGRIDQAKADWQAGRFAKVVGDEEEFIPLP
ncbi:pirin family protein [Spongiibacter taiwanensis]|uniref:pirin family protein n=1 Tax=Spongiibacter taiwanensis TaxID=1748242 RepID=UPI00203621CE|nr:pirin family protein [Spongiibacter taiwanensis]USA42310.1 pirin family protein [Spongiibacter taiwanensis]